VVGHFRVGSITEQAHTGFIQWSWIDGGSLNHDLKNIVSSPIVRRRVGEALEAETLLSVRQRVKKKIRWCENRYNDVIKKHRYALAMGSRSTFS